MSYYESNAQWPSPGQNNWEHQAPPARTSASGPTPQDEFAFYYQFEEVDRAYENLAKSGKTYGAGGRREYPTPGSKFGAGASKKSLEFNGRAGTGAGSRPHSVNNNFDDSRGHPGSNLQNFYATQRHQSSRGSNDAEQMMQAKRRMAAQRERELRNLHTEQQYQRTAVTEIQYPGKGMSEEETRDLIARQRSALYGEGAFAEKGGYVDENGAVRTGVPVHSGPSSLRGHSPMTYDLGRSGPPGNPDANTPVSATDGPQGANAGSGTEHGSGAGSTASPQPTASNNKNAFDSAVSQAAARTTNSSPGGSPPRQELPAGSKPAQPNASVAPIGTRPSGAPAANASGKRSTTPLASPGGWGRGNGVWGQSSGLSATSASVWG